MSTTRRGFLTGAAGVVVVTAARAHAAAGLAEPAPASTDPDYKVADAFCGNLPMFLDVDQSRPHVGVLMYGLLCLDRKSREVLVPNAAKAGVTHVHTPRLWAFYSAIERLKGIDSSPDTNRRYYADLTASRLTQLHVVRARLVEQLALPPAIANRRDAIHVLPGAGCLIFDDRVVDPKCLKAIAWVQVDEPAPLLPVVTGPLSTLQQQPQPWHLSRVNKPHNLNGAGIVVGVIDSGYDAVRFPELTFVGVSAIYSPGKLPKVPAPAGDKDTVTLHGSGVCAFLAGSTSGMAPGAHIAVAVVPPPGSAASNSAALYYCIDWLLKHTTSPPRWPQTAPSGCDVINLSQASTTPGVYSTGLVTVLDDARTKYNTLVVASIGNDGASKNLWRCCPGAYKTVLAVGAVDKNDIVDCSAWGIAKGVKRPDLVAPGVALEQPAAVGPPTVLRTGTSFAAALVMQKHASCRNDVVALTAKLKTLVRPAAGANVNLAGSPLSDAAGAGVLDLSTL